MIDCAAPRRIEGCGHWTQQEKPDQVSRLMLDWLTRRLD